MDKQSCVKMFEELSEHAKTAPNMGKGEGYWKGAEWAYANASRIAGEIEVDKPKKHAMPKFFDEWAKPILRRHDKYYAIALISRAGWGYGVDNDLFITEKYPPRANTELLVWVSESANDGFPNRQKAVEALLNGYELMEEPLYEVTIGEFYLIKILNDRNDFNFITQYEVHKWEEENYHLTEAEIKAVDERLWAFATPVGEE